MGFVNYSIGFISNAALTSQITGVPEIIALCENVIYNWVDEEPK